jgi:hypothetical protein
MEKVYLIFGTPEGYTREYLKGRYDCTIDLLFGLESAISLLTIFVLFTKQANPNQSNRRSKVQ